MILQWNSIEQCYAAHIVQIESGVTMLFKIVDYLELCGQHGIFLILFLTTLKWTNLQR